MFGIIKARKGKGGKKKRGFPGCRLENLSRLNGCRRCCRMSQTFTPRTDRRMETAILYG